MTRIGVAGSGRMAAVRARALAAVPGVEIVGVASRRPDRAAALAASLDCAGFDSYAGLAATRPDALLVELPHRVQDDVVHRALVGGMHVLVGGPLASDPTTAREVVRLAEAGGRVVEAGYEARYKEVWRTTRRLLADGAIGELVCVRAIAQLDQDRDSWYYDEALSGGMPVTHLSYCFLNPLRWLFGPPQVLSALSNRKARTDAAAVVHETCVATLRFAGDVLCTLTGGYVLPAGPPAWELGIVGTEGVLTLAPGDAEPGSLILYRRGHPAESFAYARNTAFAEQARAFVAATRGEGEVLNPAADALRDVELCAMIASSAASNGTALHLPPEPRRDR
jgi:predicted dehydrogenase